MAEKIPEKIDFTDVDFSNAEVMNKQSYRRRRCPIIVSLADAQITPVDIQLMLEAGMNIAKFSMSTDDSVGEKMRILDKIDKAALNCCKKYLVSSWPVATCVEIVTHPIVKTGVLDKGEDSININENTEVILTRDKLDFNRCRSDKIFVDYTSLNVDIKVGTEISLRANAEEVILKCLVIVNEKSIKCIVTKGGQLKSYSNAIAKRDSDSESVMSKSNCNITKFALEYQIDVIIINDCENADTVKAIKSYIKSKKAKMPVLLCVVCTEAAFENIEDIIQEGDGIILSREQSPYRMEGYKLYRLPNIQKWISSKCLKAGKPCFVTGGVCDDALKNGDFNNTEISDVTNLLLDGVSGFILRDCYNTEYIVQVLKGINELCYTVEPLLTSKTRFRRIIDEMAMPANAAETSVISCAMAANQSNARVIIMPTVSGKTIRYLHWMRPSCLVLTVSTDVRVTRLLQTYRSVLPLLFGEQHENWGKTVEARVHFAVEYAVKRSFLFYGDTYVTLQRDTEFSSFCDMVRIWKVSVQKKALVECPDN